MQPVTNPVNFSSYYCMQDTLSSWSLCNNFSFLTRSVHVIYSIPLQHHISILSSISDLFSEVLKFQYLIKLCSKCRTLLAFAYISVQFSGENILLHFECCFCHGNSGFNFTCASWIICYLATKTPKKKIFLIEYK